MKKLMLLIALGGLAPFAMAQTASFEDADTNEDGALSTTEAEMALPDILIVDSNNDGMLNPAEAEVAVPGLALSSEDKEAGLIGSSEYESIVEAVEQQSSADGDV